ncbi:MAG: DNA polymerase I [Clostridia bacterium]|nr:DNA polymerase I [Clostridia bacterium]
MKNLLVIDGNSILNRAYFGIRPLTTKDGLPTNAVYGFITIIKKHIDALKPDYLVCAFDLKAPTFRHKGYGLYKANRHPMPDDLAAQLPVAKDVARAMGFKVIELEGYEADDVIGTVCRLGDEGGVRSYALTGDRDSLQLLTDKTSVILVKTKEDVVYTPEKFKEDFGVTPREYIDVKALMGDSSDNIPGVKGIGDKTAFKLISEVHSLENLYENIDAAELGKAAKEKIASGRDDAFMSRWLATIVKDAPIGYTLDELETEGVDAANLEKLFMRLEFSALYKKFDFSSKKSDGEGEQSAVKAEVREYETAGADGFSALSEPVALEVKDAEIFATDGEKHIKGTLSDEIISSVAKKKTVCHDLKKLCRSLGTPEIDCAFDTMLAAYLINPGSGSYPVDKAAFSYLSEALDATDGGAVCDAVMRLYPALSAELENLGMTKLLLDIEIPLAKVLYCMETAGMKIDAGGMRAYSAELSRERDEYKQRVFGLAGHEFNLNSPKQLGEVLFEEQGLPCRKKTKNGYSTDAETLSSLVAYSPLVADVLSYRKCAKLISTYTEVLPNILDGEGRVHTTFNQTGTATGRLSSNDPNLQNIPVRGELGREIRKYFVADEGRVLIDADYSQIELRVLAEISGDENMQSAFLSGTDIHTATASQVFGVPEFMVDSELRRRAKAVNFGIVYGIGAFSLSKDLGISKRQADEYIENYLKTYPKVDSYLKNTVASAKENGYTVTAFGRRRPIPELSSPKQPIRAFGERVAMNSPVQGSAADIIKLAMINVDRALKGEGLDAKLIMQVHDELIVEASERDAARASEILKREMESVIDSTVPMSVEISTGKNWLEAK